MLTSFIIRTPQVATQGDWQVCRWLQTQLCIQIPATYPCEHTVFMHTHIIRTSTVQQLHHHGHEHLCSTKPTVFLNPMHCLICKTCTPSHPPRPSQPARLIIQLADLFIATWQKHAPTQETSSLQRIPHMISKKHVDTLYLSFTTQHCIANMHPLLPCMHAQLCVVQYQKPQAPTVGPECTDESSSIQAADTHRIELTHTLILTVHTPICKAAS